MEKKRREDEGSSIFMLTLPLLVSKSGRNDGVPRGETWGKKRKKRKGGRYCFA